MTATDLFGFLGAIVALPGARCRGRHHLFDPPTPHEDELDAEDRHRQALGLCSHCPSAQRCRDWFDGLPPKDRPKGVVAGQVNQ
jgi:hypothetical protein